jgi:hypothetical protein
MGMFSKKESVMLVSLDSFIQRVETLKNISDAYCVFEDECSVALRDLIYSFAGPDAAEPFREAMHNLGFDAY